MGLVHAKILNRSDSRGEAIEVQFNPSEYTIQRGAHYAELKTPGLDTPIVQYVRGTAQTLSLELFLDDTHQRGFAADPPPGESARAGDLGGAAAGGAAGAVAAATPGRQSLTDRLRRLRALVEVAGERHAPPVVEFQWTREVFVGVVTELSEKFLLFDHSGIPLRARVTVKLKAYRPAAVQHRATPRSSPDRTRVRVVREGETLQQLAEEVYGDPRLWRELARANGIERPRFIAPGTPLRVPALT